MKNLILLTILYFSCISFGFTAGHPTDKKIDITKGVIKQDFVYKGEELAWRLQFGWTELDTVKPTELHLDIKFSGIINWKNKDYSFSTKKLKSSLYEWDADTLFVYIRDNSNNPAKKDGKWYDLNIESFSVNASYLSFPVNVPATNHKYSNNKLFDLKTIEAYIGTQATIPGDAKSRKKAVIEIELTPTNRKYLMTDLSFQKEGSLFVPFNLTSSNVVINNGLLKYEMNLESPVSEGTYIVKAKFIDSETGFKIPPVEEKVVLIDSRVPQIISIEPASPIKVTNEKTLKIRVNTTGKPSGEFKLVINDRESPIKSSKSKEESPTTYVFELSELEKKNIKNTSFYFEDGLRKLPETYKIEKVQPICSQMKFESFKPDGSDEHKIRVSFTLPKWVTKERIDFVIGERYDFTLSGNNMKEAISQSDNNLKDFTVEFGKNLPGSGDKIEEDVITYLVFITVDGKIASTPIMATFINKQKADELEENINAEMANKPSKRNFENIEKWVTQLKDLSEKAGVAIDGGEFDDLLSGLKESKGEKALSVTKKIFGWIGTLAGLVLPI